MPFSYFSKNFNLQIMKNLVFLLLFSVTLVSCDKKQIYHEYENDLPEKRWKESDVKTYEFEITETDKTCNVIIEISNVLGTEMNVFPVDLKITKPDGSVSLQLAEIKLNDKDCLGDICDEKVIVLEKFKFVKGKYKIEVSPKSKFGFVPNIIGVGLSVEIKE